MSINVRRLMRNGKNQVTTAADYVTEPKPANGLTASKKGNGSLVVRGRSVDVKVVGEQVAKEHKANANLVVEERKEFLETANTPGIAGGGIVGKSAYNSILENYLYTDIDAEDAAQIGKSNNSPLHRIYKDMYYHDPICGMAVDLMSNMPFSEFSLTGAKDSKIYAKYEDSIYNMNIQTLLPILSTEYLVQGLFVSTNIFDKNEGIFTGLVPQRIDLTDVQPVPIFGRDPLITLRVGEAYKSMATSDDPRMKEYLALVKDGNASDTLRPDPQDVTYIARRALLRDYRGVSIYRRILPAWLLERALYRGTLDQSMKRQRAITHLMAGDNEWTPTQEEMGELADLLIAADLDPVGAIFVTRTGVNVQDVRSANDLWKVTDLTDFFTQAKLRSLGISESFLSGDASYNSLEQAMSVFIEQIRGFREMITYELFYDKTFPRISQANDYQKRRYALDTASVDYDHRQLELFGSDDSRRHLWMDRSSPERLTREERRDLFVPQVQWHKRLRPEADQEYMTLLQTLQENNVPVPLRIWAAAGGLDINSVLNQKDDDIKLRKDLKDWMKIIRPPEMGEGMPGAPEGGGGADELDLSALSTAGYTPRRSNMLDRFKGIDPDMFSARNMSGLKRHILSPKGAKIMEEKINKQVASVAAEIGARVNKMEAKMEENFRDLKTSKIYTTGK